MRFWTTMQTRQGWSWTCTHPEVVAHLLSEWLNDNAPLGERMYLEPAKAVLALIEAGQ